MNSTILVLSVVCLVNLANLNALDWGTDDCDKVYGCFRLPSGCINSECTYLAKWRNDTSDYIEFIISSKQDFVSDYWLAIAFSTDKIMGNDSDVMCQFYKNNSFTVQSYFNTGREPPVILDPVQPSVGITDPAASTDNGYLSCSFKRLKADQNESARFYDLNEKYYLFMAKAEIKTNSELGYHESNRVISPEEIEFGFSPPAFSINITTADCNVNYGCFRIPDGCQSADCTYLTKWRNFSADYIELIVSYKKAFTADTYVAIAFSTDQIMGNDTDVICKFYKNGLFAIESYWNVDREPPVILDKNNRTVGLYDSKISVDQGHLSCSFKRLKSVKNETRFFDLKNTYYLFMATATIEADGSLAYHASDKVLSANKIDFSFAQDAKSKFSLVKVHGILMILAWIILASTALLSARYFKPIFPDFQIAKLDMWFFIHRSFMQLVVIISVVSFILVFFDKHWTWVDSSLTLEFSHSIVGITTIGSALVQPVMAFFRPGKNDDKRPKFNIAHRFIGVLTFLLSVSTIFMGLRIELDNNNWIVLAAWLGWLMIAVLVLEYMERSESQSLFVKRSTNQVIYCVYFTFLSIHFYVDKA